MTEPPIHETEEDLAAIDDQDLAALVNAAFAMEVSLAHQTDNNQKKGAPLMEKEIDIRETQWLQLGKHR